MILLGFFLIVLGAVLNVILLRGPLSTRLTPGQILGTWPWLMSLLFVVAGVVLVIAGSHAR